MMIKSYLKKQEISQINNLTLYLKKLKREEPKPLKVSRRKEIIKIKAEIIEKEIKKTIAKINKTKSQFFEKIKKNRYTIRVIKKKREKTQINKIRHEKGKFTTDTTEIQRIIRDHNKQLYANKMDNPEGMDKLLGK